MSTNSEEIPEFIDIQLTLRACKPLGNGRKGWEPPQEVKFKWSNGLAVLKSEIDRVGYKKILYKIILYKTKKPYIRLPKINLTLYKTKSYII